MNRLFKYVYTGLIGLMAIGTSACSDDDDNYSPGEQPEGAQVYFPTSNPASLTLSSTESSFNINILRIVTDEALSVPLTVTGNEEGLYTVPSSVSFAAGQAQASITVTYDPDAVGFDTYTTLTIEIGSNITPYGQSAYSVNVGIPAPWTVVATGTYQYAQYWVGTDSGLKLYQNDITPELYKIENWGNGVDFTFTYNENTGEVLVDDQETGYTHSTYGTLYVDDLVDYTGGPDLGISYYEDGVFHFSVIYYVDAGYFGYGEETFTLD